MTTLRDAIRAATNDTTITTPKIQKDVQGNVLATNPGEEVKVQNSPIVDGAIQGAASVGAGIVSAGNELVTGAVTMYGAVVGDQEVIDEAEARRKGLNQDLNTFRDSESAGIGDNVAFGISKYLLGAGGVGAGVAKVLPKVALSGLTATAAATGAIAYQETKSDLMEQGVSREDANNAGIIQGVGMGASIFIPVAGIGRIASIKQGIAQVGASAAVTTAAMSGTSAVTGVYLGNRAKEIQQEEPNSLKRVDAYNQASRRFGDMATDPTSIALGVGLGGAIGGVVARGKFKAYKADVALINSLKGDPSMITPSMVDDLELGNLDSPEIKALRAKYGEEIVEALTEYKGKPRRVLTQEDIDNGLKQEDIDLQYRKDIAMDVRITVAQRFSQSDIDPTVLTDSDYNLVLRNDRILAEYNRTGNEDLLDQLEIPQVHRDAYLLSSKYDGGLSDYVKEEYFNLDKQRYNYEEGNAYVSPTSHKMTRDGTSTANITTRGNTPTPNTKVNDSGRQPYIHQILGKAEAGGKYDAFNNGVAGDRAGQALPSNITVGQIMAGQKTGAGRLYFAVGKYQIIPKTMQAAVKALGIDANAKFTPELQERIFRDYLVRGKRPQIHAFITGASNDLEAAQLAMSQEFASVGIPKNIGSRNKDASYYSSGNNRASVSSRDIGLALEAQRKRYQALVNKGVDPEDAWTQSFYTNADTNLSAVVRSDMKTTTSVDNVEGKIFEGNTRDTVIDVDYDPSILTKLREGFQNTQTKLTNLVRGTNEPLPFPSRNTYDEAFKEARTKGFDEVAAQSRAIQKLYEEKSYQYALQIRNRARDEFNVSDEQELTNILQNGFNSHQQSLKIGKSKLFNEELTNIKTLYPDSSYDEQVALALSNTNQRMKQASYVRVAPAVDTGINEDIKSKVDDIAIDRNVNLNGKTLKVVEEEVRFRTDKDGKIIPYRVKRSTTTKDSNTKDSNSIESIVKLEDGSTLTRISTRLPNGKVINRFIDTNGNISNFAATSRSPTLDQLTALVQMRLQGADTVVINGKTVTKQELVDQLNNTRKIDNAAVEQFALCAL